MKVIKYDKLIRDNIPTIIENAGKTCVYEVMDDNKYMDKLSEKLQEEVLEYSQEQKNNNVSAAIEELADIEEIILALLAKYNVSLEEFDDVRRRKVKKNGAFDNKYLLKEVREDD